ncbi:MAG TPA: hybrid sensor histidine kinase/response regulator [bacterium]|nr:hybrid sensor histidine kinase/response regulator [bacterium]
MLKDDKGFLKELLAMFKIEAEEHIKAMSSGLLDYEKKSDAATRLGIIETVYREAHSLKGASRAVNLVAVETMCQSLESVFSAMKREVLFPSTDQFDTLHEAVDLLPKLVESPDTTETSELIHRLEDILKEEEKTSKKTAATQNISSRKMVGAEKIVSKADTKSKESDKQPEKEKPLSHEPDQQAQAYAPDPPSSTVGMDKTLLSETVRIATHKLDSILLQTEEMLAAKLASMQQVEELKQILNFLDVWKKEWEIYYPEIKAVSRFMASRGKTLIEGQAYLRMERLLDFFDWHMERVKNLEDHFAPIIKMSEESSKQLGGMVDGLLDDMKMVLMLPFSTLLKIMPKVVRDLSRDQGKDVELIVKGSTVEVSRRILEEMKDPLIHILRNCVDHGIEKPDERVRLGKPSGGTITVSVSQLGADKVEILVNDDGQGIDGSKVKQVAVKRGLISHKDAAKLSEEESRMLIFQSEISTSPIITDISGRGLGLAIVREKVERLGGSVMLESEPGKGTTFRIVLPVALATFRGIMVRAGDQTFVLPTINVDRVTRVLKEDIKTVENRETISLNGRALSFVRLADVLEIPVKDTDDETSDHIQVVVLNAIEKRIAFGVDEVLSEQEVLVKKLGRQLSRVRNVAGAMIYGTGKVLVLLNVIDLMKSAMKVSTAPRQTKLMEEEKALRKSILIAEDSITSRTLLKNILESAGYNVKATVDGVDAFTELRADEYHMVVSDIEMPRMNGFELVTKIRQNKKTAELPVILVTGLESKEDRERGIDVGANAYIVKRSFDQSNLLQVIKKLI